MTIKYSQGDVVTIPFPWVEGTGYEARPQMKRRPALIISTHAHHEISNKRLCLAISHSPGKNRYEHRVKEWSQAGLKKNPSWVIVDKAFSMEDVYIKKIGEMNSSDLADVMEMFNQVIR